MRYRATVSPIAPRCILELRGDAAAAGRCAGTAGLALPGRPNRIRRHGEADIAWLGPRRWLVTAPASDEAVLGAAILGRAEAEPLLAAALVSDMYSGFAVAGSGCRDILAQGTPLDLAPAAFPDDMATATDFFGAPVILRRAGGIGDGFELWSDRSLAVYVGDWLAAALGAP